MSKARLLAALSLFLIGAFIATGQTWYQVSMSPNGETVTLQTFDGYTAYSWASPLLLVCLAALAVALLTSGRARAAIFSVGSLSAISLLALSAVSVANQDLAGVAKQLETATGIAATHGIQGLETTSQPAALICIVLYGLIGLVFAISALTQHRWVARPKASGSSKKAAELKDAISLWDEQR